MKITTIIPVRNGGQGFRLCLEAITGSIRRPDQIFVVDDGSTDGSVELAESFGAHVMRTVPAGGVPRGPAVARNLAAGEAGGDVLVFLDADVVVQPNTIGLIESHLDAQPKVAALFGSYDDNPPVSRIVARYKNLLHHHTHQNARAEASTFWAGCGAIRRRAFEAVGGFDERFTRPSVEDIELGLRLCSRGARIRCQPDIQVSHLKQWTLVSMVKTDILHRAIPWSRLILQGGSMPNDLNLDTANRISALSSLVFFGCLPLAFFFPGIASVLALIALASILALNIGLVRLLYRRGGLPLAIGGVALHTLFLLYSSVTFAVLLAIDRVNRLVCAIRRAPGVVRRVFQAT